MNCTVQLLHVCVCANMRELAFMVELNLKLA